MAIPSVALRITVSQDSRSSQFKVVASVSALLLAMPKLVVLAGLTPAVKVATAT